MTWDEAVAFALSLPGTELSTSYGQPAVKVASNGRAFLFTSHEADTSFGVAMDFGTIEILKATEPETYWQTAHYEGWEGVLVRYQAKDDERVREVIERSREFAAAKPKARPRKR
ncbi:MAG TPA: MmcQ/YjbR family DNA-binding protein [Sphingomicrobium sp.]|nr:MmcQ/YjbR family DNA-binding protein [Sphingomicrobium sp.]